ncbi:THUMP domain-containing protein 3 isoform X1 [Scyliorhinus canicula]|uniref:THUMP domain-containing protein 3 isoform X1 n=2 Tax=Scyliorhinus canicula TaxID=7830 RepID=UPI0018F56BB7|nr:THUMP domain-containing protein 3 isoform X1 [Scyliorhinus canicula]XP_038666724.1 THUMP domain-containing protein 3 isoform X1 [Scyliorhinus canicula]
MSVRNGSTGGPTATAMVPEVEEGPFEHGDAGTKQPLCTQDGWVTIGATVPTGFENTAADEVLEKIGSKSRISKDRGKIYFAVSTDNLFQIHLLRSVDNLFVVIQEFPHYQFGETKENVLEDLRQLAGQLLWVCPLTVWELNNSLKKKKGQRRNGSQGENQGLEASQETDANKDGQVEPVPFAQTTTGDQRPVSTRNPPSDTEGSGNQPPEIKELTSLPSDTDTNQMERNDRATVSPEGLPSNNDKNTAIAEAGGRSCGLLRFRVTCNRSGEKHSFTSMEAAREFGGAVQDLFQWKADMTKFDVEILLNIHENEVVIGIALTEESLHKRNITHFGPTTLRSTLAYGMLRLCNPLSTDIIVDPMCGTAAIPIEGALEFSQCYFLGGDNNTLAVNRSINNINSLQKKRLEKGRITWGLPLDVVQWDICNLPLKTSSVDVVISDMPFGKRMGSRRKNWDLYPACLKEMGRICRPETGRAALLTQDKKCFIKAMSRMGHLWRKSHTAWVNVGGLHAAVYLLKRTGLSFDKLLKTPQESSDHPEIPCEAETEE